MTSDSQIRAQSKEVWCWWDDAGGGVWWMALDGPLLESGGLAWSGLAWSGLVWWVDI
jgi:hypothetical protein